MLLLRLSLIPFFYFCWILKPSAQEAGTFQVVYLPRKTGYSLQTLQKEIDPLKNRKDIERFLKSRPVLRDVEITLTARNSKGSQVWLTINSADKKKEEISWMVLQSKSTTSSRYNNINELIAVLSDSLIVVDSLKLGLFMQGNRYNNNGFSLKTPCANSNIQLKVDREGYTVISRELFPCTEDFIPIELYNTTDNQRILSKVVLRFLQDDDIDKLSQMARYVKQQNNNSRPAEVFSILKPYINQVYGKVADADFIRWIAVQVILPF